MRWLMVLPARPLALLLGAGSQATVSLGTSNPLRKWLAAIRPARHVATYLQQHPAGADHVDGGLRNHEPGVDLPSRNDLDDRSAG